LVAETQADIYLKEADRLRDMAKTAISEEARQEFLQLARQYEALARQPAEARVPNRTSPAGREN
jgi:hypothetical protein